MNASPLALIPERPLRRSRFGAGILVCGAVFLAVNAAAYARLPDGSGALWLVVLLWCGLALATELWLNRRAPDRDRLLFPMAMFMAGWGVMAIYRLLPRFGEKQAVWLCVAVFGLAIAAGFPQIVQLLRRYRYLVLLAGIAMLLATILFGANPSAAPGAPRLWLNLAGFYVQPAEVLKILLVAFLASYLAEQVAMPASSTPARRWGPLPGSARILGPILLMWGLSLVVLVWQRDLGAAILFFIVFALMLYAATGQLRVLIGALALIVSAGVAAYIALDVVRLRIDIWLNPWIDPDGRAYQIVQSLMSVASGGLGGQGIGQGFPFYVPVSHSDFILSALAEEWGLVGVVVATGLIAAIVSRAIRAGILWRGGLFEPLLAFGLGCMIAVQSLMIMGGVLKVLPLTGVTLPFLSYGGSSLVVVFVMIGLLISVSRTR